MCIEFMTAKNYQQHPVQNDESRDPPACLSSTKCMKECRKQCRLADDNGKDEVCEQEQFKFKSKPQMKETHYDRHGNEL